MEASLSVKDPVNISKHDQLLRSEGRRDLSCGQIGVDVIGNPLLIHAGRGDDRNEGLLLKGPDHPWVHRDHLPDEPQVYPLILSSLPPPVRSLPGPDKVPILPGQAHRRPAAAIDQAHDLLIDAPHHDGFHDAHGLRIGDPKAVDESGGEPGLRHRFPDLGTAAVDDHRTHPDIAHQDDVLRHLGHQLLLHHSGPPILHHNGLSEEAPNIGEGLYEDPGLGDC